LPAALRPLPKIATADPVARIRPELIAENRTLCILQPTVPHPRLQAFLSRADKNPGMIRRAIRKILHLERYRINPRDLSYVLKQAANRLVDPGTPSTMHILLSRKCERSVSSTDLGRFEEVLSVDSYNGWFSIDETNAEKIRTGFYSRLILLYPDAVGIGWSHLEKQLRTLWHGPIQVLNGRGRAFDLRTSHTGLSWRRAVDRLWGAETAFFIAFVLSLPFVLLAEGLRTVLGQRPAWRCPATNSDKDLDDSSVLGVQSWWTENPMVYGLRHGSPVYEHEGKVTEVEPGDTEFFENVDEQFYAWNRPLHASDRPFDRIFPYDEFKGRRVLEVGCGMGTMAMNWAIQGARISPVDLTKTAVRQTKRRFTLKEINCTPCQAQAESLPFADESFPYAYSWGVLHHTPNIRKTLQEIHRVLEPGGRAGVMLYNRSSVLYLFWIRFYEGWLHREGRFLDPVELASRYGDGSREEGNPHTWPVTEKEIYEDLFRPFSRVRVTILGTELDNIFRRVMPGIGSILPRFVKKAYARRWGWSLWIEAIK
jgi:ubiquinone/menaquinone biosynthesis C-methylase UbiE